MMETAHRFPFREYLHLQGAIVGKPPQDDEYDDFILKVWMFFDLRARAEDYFQAHPYVAKSTQGALPLPWREIKSALEKSGPPETVLTLIAKRHYGTIASIVGNIRKMLAREWSKVPIGRVQQIDSHCLRWLTRQPGYSPIEKAGARQEILGVVRRENFDMLENRVLKDLLRRCLALSSMYLRKNGKAEWGGNATVVAVRRLEALCIEALEQPEFEKVKTISELPQPNYVLQQDRLYSLIWGEYLKILREEDIAERLWNRRDAVAKLYDKLYDGVSVNCSPFARYDTYVWFNQLDGRNPIVEGRIWDNELLVTPTKEPVVQKEDVVIIDPTFPWDNRDTLICPNDHPNARPFIQNPHKPSKEPGIPLRLEEILENRDAEHLADYFSYLHGIIGGKRWVVLVPDHWDAAWLEKVICAKPAALARSDMFLLWRSIATAIGYQIEQRKLSSGESLLIEDGYCRDKFNAISIRFMDDGNGCVVPQRASLRLHGEKADSGDVRFLVGRNKNGRTGLAKLNCPNSYGWRVGHLCGGDDLLIVGVRDCLRKISKGLVPYFDEIDALSLVVTTRAEEVVFSKPIVPHIECWPGGKKFTTDEMQPVGILYAGSKKLALYLAEGKPRDDLKLKEWTVDFDVATKDDTEIMCRAEITPGQGLAVARFFAPFLKSPKLVDIGSAKPSDMTRIRIERELKRHFPPTMPLVEACEEIWRTIKDQVNDYLFKKKPISNDLFARAQNYWGEVDPCAKKSSGVRAYGKSRIFDDNTMSPIDRLKRENVFGNAKDHRVPDATKSYGKLFKALVNDTYRDQKYLRLVAWTYQFDNPDLEPLRKSLFEKYVVKGDSLNAVETSFCANNFDDNDARVGKLLVCALANIANGSSKENDMRLAYNLMQFHPIALSSCDTMLCEKAFYALVEAFNDYPFYSSRGSLFPYWNRSTQTTKMAGYFIKCMLFILHRRRFDPNCLVNPSGWSKQRETHGKETLAPCGLLGKELPRHTIALQDHESMRRALIEYVNGRGTLDGIPSN